MCSPLPTRARCNYPPPQKVTPHIPENSIQKVGRQHSLATNGAVIFWELESVFLWLGVLHWRPPAVANGERCAGCPPFLIPSVVVDVVLTISSPQAPLRRRRQLEHRGPAHPSQARLPGAVTARGFPNTLIQVHHICESRRPNAGEMVYGTGAAGGPVKL